MKYLELVGKIKTIFERTGEPISVESLNDETIDVKVKESIEKIKEIAKGNKDSNKSRRAPVMFNRMDGDSIDFIKKVNAELELLSNDVYCIFANKLELRDLSLMVKINDDHKINEIIEEIENHASQVIKRQIDIILTNNDKEKEVYAGIEFEVKDAEIKDFYFNGLMKPDQYGLNTNKFAKNIRSSIDTSTYYNYDKIGEYIYEYSIPKKLTKDEFCETFKVQLLNKSFRQEVDRIYNHKEEYNVRINPVHYELTEYDEFDRLEFAKALATALYSVGRIKSNKMVKFCTDIYHNYIQNQVLYMLIKNLKDSFVLFEFSTDRHINGWDRDEYIGRTGIRTKELTDNINELKDEVQFAFYVDKYQDKVRSAIYDELISLNIVTFDNKLDSNRAQEYVRSLAEKENIEVDQKLINMVEMSKNDLTLRDAKDLFDNYKEEKAKNIYFPEYKDYFEGRGNVDNYVDPYDELMSMTGLHNVKKVVNEIIGLHKINEYKKEHFMECKGIENIKNSKYSGNTIPTHMVFMGNPGTCKTTVAKMIAKIFKSRGIIKNDRTEIFGTDGKCIHLENAFKYAYGGVLFIDEAYSFHGITELVALMENHRNDVMVILAGYTDAMKQFLHYNEGLTSRFNYFVEFEDYTEDELWDILNYQAKKENLIIDEAVKEKVMPIFASSQANKEMGNGRLVRKMLQMAMSNQANRLSRIDFESGNFDLSNLNELKVEDFELDYKKLTGTNPPKIIGNQDPEVELENMIGLTNIKNMVKKCVAASHMNMIRKDSFSRENNNFISNPMHLAFLGNPGTAKTTVARLVARILKKKGIIKKEHIVEVGRKDLVAKYVGNTAPQVEAVFRKAKGGVLFIDEAYSLVDDRSGSFGDEAINTIIAEMENHRDDVIVIFAGYTNRMREFIARNEGLRSRLSYILEFNDYTEEELYKIFEKMISDENLIVTFDAKEHVKNVIGDVTKNKDFGNGRFVRKLIENAKLNMDYRLSKLNKSDYSSDELMTLQLEDFNDLENDKVLDRKEGNLIGFAA